MSCIDSEAMCNHRQLTVPLLDHEIRELAPSIMGISLLISCYSPMSEVCPIVKTTHEQPLTEDGRNLISWQCR
jgi:hypothetical protein